MIFRSIILFIGLLKVCSCAPQLESFLQYCVQAEPLKGNMIDADYWDDDDPSTYEPPTMPYDFFDLGLIQRKAEGVGNFLISPFGVKTAIGLLAEASTDTTQVELINALGFQTDRYANRKKYSEINNFMKMNSTANVMDAGSRIYLNTSNTPRARFAAIAQEFYGTDLVNLDYSNPTLASQDINSWVSGVTKGRIPDLITEAEFRDASLMVMNTMFIHGTWRHQFDSRRATARVFYYTARTSKILPFMRVQNTFYYADSLVFDAKILRMPFLGNKLAMNIIIPNSATGFARIMDNLQELHKEMGFLRERLVDVNLPKFQFADITSYRQILSELGVREAFGATASFPGVSRGQQLNGRWKLSTVLQKVGIEVNEYGPNSRYKSAETSDTSATGSVLEVIANRPFFFLVEYEPLRQVLLAGRLADPAPPPVRVPIPLTLPWN